MNRLKELRQEKKLTQKELADEIGTTKLTISNWENEKHVIRSDKAQKLADYFGVSIPFLLGFIDERKENLIDFDVEDEEFTHKGREFVRTLVSDVTLQQFEELFFKQSGLPPMFTKEHDGTIRNIDTSYIVHEKLTHIYWLIGIAPTEYQEIIAKWSLLSYNEHNKIIELINLLISTKID